MTQEIIVFGKKLDYTQKTIEFIGAFIESEHLESVSNKLMNNLIENGVSAIVPDELEYEIGCVFLELFATACAVKDINIAIEQSIFMKKYMHQRHLDDYWDAMEPYNKRVSESAIAGLDSSSAGGRFKITYVTQNRYNMAKKYLEINGQESGDEAVGRAINRFGVKPSKMFEGISAELCEQLQIEQQDITSLIMSWYKIIFKFVKS